MHRKLGNQWDAMLVRSELLLSVREKRAAERIDGTIVDLETIGDFAFGIGPERYRSLQPVSLGFLSGATLEVVAPIEEGRAHEAALRDICQRLLSRVPRPFYAFNAEFEMGVLYWFLGQVVQFDRDIQLLVPMQSGATKPEAKWYVTQKLAIPDFADPFGGKGVLVPLAWKKYIETGDEANLLDIVRHNRACLLKEYWILKTRNKWRPAKAFCLSKPVPVVRRNRIEGRTA